MLLLTYIKIALRKVNVKTYVNLSNNIQAFVIVESWIGFGEQSQS
jgi:hypothetical protein